MTKKIVFLTGTRADFGKLKPLIEKVEKSKGFTAYIFVTGMHTLKKYGGTSSEVTKQKYKNIFIYMNQTNTSDHDSILANTVIGFGNFVKEIKPDTIVIHGDRIEALAGAIIGSLNNILISHIEGGEISGTIDDSLRHAITKLSHLHFVANNKAKKRLMQLGEKKQTIYIIGSPEIDIMLSNKLPSINKVRKYYQIPFSKYSILIFHPVTTELDTLHEQSEQLVAAILDSKLKYVVIYPNNDPGTDIIFSAYNKLKHKKNFKILPSMRFEYFLTLLRNADFLIGNSSVGIREAGIYGIPTINVGMRQKRRSNNKKIINIESNYAKILKAIKNIPKNKEKPVFEFGKGQSAKLFLEIIKKGKIWKTPIQKEFVDIK